MKTVDLGQVVLGEGRPKIIAPIVARTAPEILEAGKKARVSACDLVEWRLDFFDDVSDFDEVVSLSHALKKQVDKPLLITFRTEKEGGVRPFATADYFALYRQLLTEGALDLLDVELFMPEDDVTSIVALAHEQDVKVVMCHHDFHKTPHKEELVERLVAMQDKGADICKIAVMPQSERDVLTLLTASLEAKACLMCPLIAISMGQLGTISRLAGELFGSVATFGTIEQASAPGQLAVNRLQELLSLVGKDDM